MDPLTHTMTGAVLGRSGLERRTPLAMVTLLLSANAPDVDVLTYAWGNFFARAHRRGLTHGVPALLVWPFVVAAVVLAWDRWVRRKRDPVAEPAKPRTVLVLAGLGVLTHPILDWMNTYGIRWLKPLSDRWIYGDALFIIDPWIWLVLGGALLITSGTRRRQEDGVGHEVAGRRGSGPKDRRCKISARALVLVSAYIVFMVTGDLFATREVRAEADRRGLSSVLDVMVAPLPGRPFSGDVVVELESGYLLGRHSWLSSPRVDVDWSEPLPRRSVLSDRGEPVDVVPVDRLIAAAGEFPRVRDYLVWVRYPFWRVRWADGGWLVEAGDARYPAGGRLGGPTVEITEGRLSEVVP